MFTVMYKHNARHYPTLCVVERDGIYNLEFYMDKILDERKEIQDLIRKGGPLYSFTQEMLQRTADHYGKTVHEDLRSNSYHALRLFFITTPDYDGAYDHYIDYITCADRQGLLSPKHLQWCKDNGVCVGDLYDQLMGLCEYSTDDPLELFENLSSEDYKDYLPQWNKCMENVLTSALINSPVIEGPVKESML